VAALYGQRRNARLVDPRPPGSVYLDGCPIFGASPLRLLGLGGRDPVKRERLRRAKARGSDDKVAATMAVTFCERGKSPSRARPVCCGAASEFRGRPGELASIPDSEVNPASGCRSCHGRLRHLGDGRAQEPAATADGQRIPRRPKNRHQKSDRSVQDSTASGLLGMLCPLSASRAFGFHSSRALALVA
jgi:hypothetical protein